MPSAEELTTNFYLWEERGRGWQVWNTPVRPEPPFVPFFHAFRPHTVVDDGRKPTLLSSAAEGVKRIFAGSPKIEVTEELQWPELDSAPAAFECPLEIREFQLALRSDITISPAYLEQFLLGLASLEWPVSFEVLGTASEILLQFSCRDSDATQLKQQLQVHFPGVAIRDETRLREALSNNRLRTVAFDLGLDQEFMRPLRCFRSFDPDPLTGLYGVLDNLRPAEVGLVQIIFQVAQEPWADSIMRSVTDYRGDSFFADAPEMVPLTREKICKPLFGVVVRVLAQSATEERSWEIARNAFGSLSVLSRPDSNSLIPLTNGSNEAEPLLQDAAERVTRRSGMLLNSEELVSLIHLPSPSIPLRKLRREYRKTRPAPTEAKGHSYALGENTHEAERVAVSLSEAHRLKHIHIIGATGTGKSTLLLRLILQDIAAENGCAVLDPHGDLIDTILGNVPSERARDVVLLDPSEAQSAIGFNILSARSDLEKTVLASDLVEIIRRFSASWGDQMTAVLGNAVSALLESNEPVTLLDIKRFLADEEYRRSILRKVEDSAIRSFWESEYPLLRSSVQASLLTRLDTLLLPKPLRRIFSSPSVIDFGEIVNKRKIFLARLPQGLIGEESAHLLGSLVVSKLHQTALGRQVMEPSARKHFYLYIDEFQYFVTRSMAGLLSGGRKYGLGLVLAHQDLRQLWDYDTALANSVITNAGTRICFRLGEFDAQKLKEGFKHFDASDLQSLGTGEALVRLGRSDYDFNLMTTVPQVTSEADAQLNRDRILGPSRVKVPEPSESLPKPTKIEVFMPVAEAETAIPDRLEQDLPQRVARVSVGFPGPEEPEEKKVHAYLQDVIDRYAKEKGFRSRIEAPTKDGKGRVDVGLERNGRRYAIEISVTTGPEQELHNVEKCLRDGYDMVLVCCSEKRNLKAIKDFIIERLQPEEQSKVQIIEAKHVAEFLAAEAEKERSTEQLVKGYRVKTQYRAVSPLEFEKRKEEIARTIEKSIQRLKRQQGMSSSRGDVK
ncbi:MAG: type IV secretion system DNA-binding domain-containing protein [Bacteroidota bacterium]